MYRNRNSNVTNTHLEGLYDVRETIKITEFSEQKNFSVIIEANFLKQNKENVGTNGGVDQNIYNGTLIYRDHKNQKKRDYFVLTAFHW